MKKTLFIVIITVLFAGCTPMVPPAVWNVIYEEELCGHVRYYDPDFDHLTSYEEIAEWIAARVTYDSEDNKDDIKNPKRTLKDGKGSCADIAVLFINIAYYSREEKLGVAYIDSSTQTISKTVASGGAIDHVIPYNGQVCISQYNGRIYNADIEYHYDYSEIFERRP